MHQCSLRGNVWEVLRCLSSPEGVRTGEGVRIGGGKSEPAVLKITRHSFDAELSEPILSSLKFILYNDQGKPNITSK